MQRNDNKIAQFDEGMSIKKFIDELYNNGGFQTLLHSKNVANLMSVFADCIDEDNDIYFYAGLLHDIGKLDVRPEILAKTSKLTDKEYDEVKTHTTAGPGMAKKIKNLPEAYVEAAVACAGSHHLWFRGNGGYGINTKLTRSAIPLVARVCAICDVFDAISSPRSYSPATPDNETIKIMENLNGNGQFDPLLFKIFKNKVLPLYRAKMATAQQIVAI